MSKEQNSRGKAWRRHKDYSKAIRKRNLDLERQPHLNDKEGLHIYPYYNNLHQYSDNKIHCSCPMCRNKSKNKGVAAMYNGTSNPSMMDLRRQLSMNDDYLEYFDDID